MPRSVSCNQQMVDQEGDRWVSTTCYTTYTALASQQTTQASKLLTTRPYNLRSQSTNPLAVHGLGEAVVTEGGIPLAELQVGGHDEALSFMAVGDPLKKQFGGALMEWNKANFVNDQ